MTPRIQKLTTEIDRTRTKISDMQSRLRDLEQQKTELENTEIVALFRSLDIAPEKLPDFIAAMQQSDSLPQVAPIPANAGGSGAYSSAFTRREEDDNAV